MRRPKSPSVREYIALLERHDEEWRYLGSGSGSGGDPAAVDVLDMLHVRDGGGSVGLTRRHDLPDSPTPDRWIGYVIVRLGPDVGHLLIGARRIAAPEQRRLAAVWTSPYSGRRGVRPVIVAVAPDGTELSRIGPHQGLDTHTWAQLQEEL
nr:hypothetical protein [Streptomyces sp. SID13726]